MQLAMHLLISATLDVFFAFDNAAEVNVGEVKDQIVSFNYHAATLFLILW